MSNFLSVASRTVFGTDMSLHSLMLGEEFKEKNDLRTVHFLQMNLFRPCFKPETFDLVFCNGVLHHTSDPFLRFESIARLVRPRGYVMIGLYHRYCRTITNIRRQIFRMTVDRFAFLDPNLRRRQTSAPKKRASSSTRPVGSPSACRRSARGTSGRWPTSRARRPAGVITRKNMIPMNTGVVIFEIASASAIHAA